MRTFDPASATKHDASSTSHESVDPDLTAGGFEFDVALSTAVASNGAVRGMAPVPQGPLTPQMLDKMHRYWCAANYLCIGQIYLFENPLLREPLKAEQIKPSVVRRK